MPPHPVADPPPTTGLPHIVGTEPACAGYAIDHACIPYSMWYEAMHSQTAHATATGIPVVGPPGNGCEGWLAEGMCLEFDEYEWLRKGVESWARKRTGVGNTGKGEGFEILTLRSRSVVKPSASTTRMETGMVTSPPATATATATALNSDMSPQPTTTSIAVNPRPGKSHSKLPLISIPFVLLVLVGVAFLIRRLQRKRKVREITAADPRALGRAHGNNSGVLRAMGASEETGKKGWTKRGYRSYAKGSGTRAEVGLGAGMSVPRRESIEERLRALRLV